MGFYTTAQICLNGHVVTSDIRHFEDLETYCSKCGAKTLTACPNCGTTIRGKYDAVGEPVIPYRYSPPAYCRNCGAPFPWIKAALTAADELISEEMHELTDDEKSKFKAALPDILNDSPRTTLAATRIAKYLTKLAAHAEDPYMKKRLVAEAANRLLGEKVFTVPDSQPQVQLTLFK